MGKKNNKRRENGIHVPYKANDVGPSWFLIAVTLIVPGLNWLGAILLISKLIKLGRNRKLIAFRSYAAIIGQRSEVDVRELSDKLQKSKALVMAELQEMINRGFMGEKAYLDRSRGVLVTGFERGEESDAAPVHVVVELKKQPEPEKKVVVDEPQPEPPKVKTIRPMSQMSAKETDFEEILRKMRSLNEQIADAEVSTSIDRIGSLTADIFRVVRQRPERSDEVKKFMTYYLPVTLKLLEDYALMEKQSYQSEHIRESRNRIETLLKTLINAFEKQLDNLFQRDAMDVDADISVLETMMAKDGLVSPGGLDIHEMLKKQTAN